MTNNVPNQSSTLIANIIYQIYIYKNKNKINQIISYIYRIFYKKSTGPQFNPLMQLLCLASDKDKSH